MKKPGTFGSSVPKGDFSRLSGQKLKDAKKSAFFDELAETGRPDWKKAPREVKSQYRGIFLILFSIPIILIPGWEIYRRLSGRSTKKVQEGELGDDNSIRKFDEQEKWKTERDSFLYKIFGKDFYLDGFTAKTMKRDETKPSDVSPEKR
ncbi:hypothetical protein JCM33374_g3611 [Metschnikowia sp. JCM 33374]|nr:hypothetical protein JCM33374_g3611 [Metschnikowia sp. JCM 33374]